MLTFFSMFVRSDFFGLRPRRRPVFFGSIPLRFQIRFAFTASRRSLLLDLPLPAFHRAEVSDPTSEGTTYPGRLRPISGLYRQSIGGMIAPKDRGFIGNQIHGTRSALKNRSAFIGAYQSPESSPSIALIGAYRQSIFNCAQLSGLYQQSW